MSRVLCRCGIAAFKIYQQDIDTIEYVQKVEPLRCAKYHYPPGYWYFAQRNGNIYNEKNTLSLFIRVQLNNPALF